MKSNLKILIAEPANFSQKAIEKLQELGEVTLQEIEKNEVLNALKYYDVFWFRLKFRIDREDIPSELKCKYIICAATGHDHIDTEFLHSKGVKILGLKGESDFLKTIRATAELTIGLTLSLLRNINEASADVKEFKWERDKFKGTEIFEKKVGIIGVGRLGTIVANYFKAFGADVYGYDILDFDHNICKKISITQLFETCDIISLHVSYSASTHYLIDELYLNLMKKSAVLINTSRGAVISSKSLLNALKSNKIRGAALDVLENEHQITTNELISYASKNNNLLITPHIGGNTYESFDKTELFMVTKLLNEIKKDE